ncbi:hypothetical protein DPMN_078475 [Dreissena polymorpha]|uniref:Uncharacterized protein n=1 Tax=Dreissena polymorpha TaxID=45954 RepID=A0A9D3YMA8_DREPO|nr:hypothetical protein DPMN_078475 [Dreissena polymorpha]
MCVLTCDGCVCSPVGDVCAHLWEMCVLICGRCVCSSVGDVCAHLWEMCVLTCGGCFPWAVQPGSPECVLSGSPRTGTCSHPT